MAPEWWLDGPSEARVERSETTSEARTTANASEGRAKRDTKPDEFEFGRAHWVRTKKSE
jgi:hypothetical protein